MKDIRRKILVRNHEASGWKTSDYTHFIVEIKDNILTVEHVKGREMLVAEIVSAIGRIIAPHHIERYERTRRYRFCFKQGSSGCSDTFIEIENRNGFPERKFLFHESCFDKCGYLSCFVYDFLDLCVAEGQLRIVDGEYKYASEDDVCSHVEMCIVRPRDIEEEYGWNEPTGEIHHAVRMEAVYINDHVENNIDSEAEEGGDQESPG